MTKFYTLPDTLPDEIKKFDGEIQEYVKGNINPVAFRGIRVAHGIYEQRKPETHMVRIRCAGGCVTPAQLKRVAELSHRYGAPEFHITTRSDLQLHYIDIEDVVAVYEALADSGIAPRGGGGNTIRNIIASHDSGVSPIEVFDVTPYALALTTKLISEPDSWNLPRKFKIAFSNDEHDTANATITCLGFIAKIHNGQKGFKVYTSGGMGAKPIPGKVLLDFVTDDQVYFIARAIKSMFDRYGDRRRKHASRIKFLWDKMGESEFRRIFAEYYDEARKNPENKPLELTHIPNEAKADIQVTPEEPKGDLKHFDNWKTRYVREQKQKGLFMIKVPLYLGDLKNEDGLKLAELLTPFGDNTLRLSLDQNIYIRNIPGQFIANIYNGLSNIHTLSTEPVMISNLVACTGADTCKLGICLPRGVTPAIAERLTTSSLDLDSIPDFKIHTSGCPNTCGRHHAADLGFFGRVGRKEGEMYPAYNILAGALIKDGTIEFAERIDEIHAKHVPDFVHDLLEIYLSKKSRYASFREYVLDSGKHDIQFLAEKYNKVVPELKDNPDFYIDWGAPEPFSILKGQKAECCAGVFDMIEVDANALKTLKSEIEGGVATRDAQEKLLQYVFSASRMLLVTRGIEARNEEQVFKSFLQHFIEASIVPETYKPVLEAAIAKNTEYLQTHKQTVLELGEYMVNLYKSMDDSLRFKVPEVCETPVKDDNTPGFEDRKADKPDVFKDLRGVGCPINFVKVKIAMEPMPSGQTIEVWLDDGEPIENVPNSVALEGHSVLNKENKGTHWSVLIKKA